MKLYCPITIDLYKVYPLQVMEAQQGNAGRGAIVTLTAGSAVIDPTDETVEVYAKKPDGTVSWLECSVEEGKIKIDFTNQMLMSSGMLQVELRLKNEADDITTPIFMVKVNKSNVQSAGRSENELPLLDQIKKNADDAKTAAEAAETAVGNKITNPENGAVGQILEIETVDEDGKPLTYKAVDKPEGGVDKELSQIIHASKYGMVSDGLNDTVIVVGKDVAAGDVIKYVITEDSGDITVIYDNGDTGEFNITSISHAGEEAGEKNLTAEKYCTYTFPSEMDVYLPFNIPTRISQLVDDVGFAKQSEVSKLSEEISELKENGTGTGSGATTAQANSLWAFLKKTAFAEPLTDAEINEFKTTWGITEEVEPDTPTTYTITRNLTNCTSSSEVTSISEGSAHTETITANNSYTLTGATISVTMGGSDITSSYSNGVLNISSVTGNIVITVSAVQEASKPDNPEVTLTSISATYTGGDVTVGTALTSLTGITVTATYSDGSTANVTDYTLSGEIVEGNNTITVSYSGKTTTFAVKGVAESGGDDEDIHDGYISDGLELRLDAIRNTADGHDASVFPDWYDVSGNEYDTIHLPSAGGTCYDTYYSAKTTSGTNMRLQQKIKSTDLIGKMADAFTVEVVFQPENSNDTGSTFAVDNGEYYILIKQSGQFRKMGNATLYGTAMTNENVIRHCTYVYDGSTIKMYHDGVLDTEIEGTMDISEQTFVEFWGSQDWAQIVTGTFNAGRIYTRALTAEEILTNYNNDIARFGTSNGEVA